MDLIKSVKNMSGPFYISIAKKLSPKHLYIILIIIIDLLLFIDNGFFLSL